ncbi:MAG: hypothetical protein DCO99_00660 [Synechococcus sp. XM-24]|nr:MAG: hypothetical protein DCO99_00660 [Synechococcus sp. XM-24]
MLNKPDLQVFKPSPARFTIPCTTEQAFGHLLESLGMECAMPGAHAVNLGKPALLQPQVKPKVPEQTTTGGLDRQGLLKRPGVLSDAMQMKQLQDEGLEPVVLRFQERHALRPTKRPAPSSQLRVDPRLKNNSHRGQSKETFITI